MILFISSKKSCYFIFVLFLLLFFGIIPYCFPLFWLIAIINILFISIFTAIIKIILFIKGYFIYDSKQYFQSEKFNIKENQILIYSILLPIRQEKEFVLIHLLTNIFNLQYPKDKLDVKLIVDENDLSTIEISKRLLKQFNFHLIIVPDFEIKSKPLSCNFALKFIKGTYVTIYDAEDRPEPYQLIKAVNKFSSSSSKLVCLQASLNYYNKYDNWLSYYFSIEYSMWFDFTLRAINKYGTFFPLGGTSNHFKAEKLIELGGWDGYNVTEDAELGVRILKSGYSISILNSMTEEECPIAIKAWIKQRTRWIKGFMQTFCEYLFFSKPIGIYSNINFKPIRKCKLFDILIYNLFITMSFFFFISIPLTFISFYNIDFLQYFKYSKYLYYIIYFNFALWLIISYTSFILIIFKNKLKKKFLYFPFFPFYWILHYIASIIALYSLIKNPFYWSKTEHGVSKK